MDSEMLWPSILYHCPLTIGTDYFFLCFVPTRKAEFESPKTKFHLLLKVLEIRMTSETQLMYAGSQAL